MFAEAINLRSRHVGSPVSRYKEIAECTYETRPPEYFKAHRAANWYQIHANMKHYFTLRYKHKIIAKINHPFKYTLHEYKILNN